MFARDDVRAIRPAMRAVQQRRDRVGSARRVQLRAEADARAAPFALRSLRRRVRRPSLKLGDTQPSFRQDALGAVR